VRGLSVRKPGQIDVLTASPPCQPFSINGKGLGATDERDCFPAVLESIARINPKFFCIENVTGLLTCPNYPGQPSGSYFRGVVATIDSYGYDAEWICVCSGHFTAPFLRERLLLVGIWKNRSVGVPNKIVHAVGNMINNGNTTQNIRKFIALSKNSRKSNQ
jgi:DNA (cytosine-5)-methyltransferase 1